MAELYSTKNKIISKIDLSLSLFYLVFASVMMDFEYSGGILKNANTLEILIKSTEEDMNICKEVLLKYQNNIPG